jgi:hypothetical protein
MAGSIVTGDSLVIRADSMHSVSARYGRVVTEDCLPLLSTTPATRLPASGFELRALAPRPSNVDAMLKPKESNDAHC